MLLSLNFFLWFDSTAVLQKADQQSEKSEMYMTAIQEQMIVSLVSTTQQMTPGKAETIQWLIQLKESYSAKSQRSGQVRAEWTNELIAALQWSSSTNHNVGNSIMLNRHWLLTWGLFYVGHGYFKCANSVWGTTSF